LGFIPSARVVVEIWFWRTLLFVEIPVGSLAERFPFLVLGKNIVGMGKSEILVQFK
jgi:hypothetical protein